MAEKKSLNAPWHIDYRFVDDLPDTKALQTGTVLNGLFGLIFFFLVTLLAVREIRIVSLAGEVATTEQRLAELTPKSDQLKEQGLAFDKVNARATDYLRFKDRPFPVEEVVLDFLIERPEDVRYTVLAMARSDVVVANKPERTYEIVASGLVPDLRAIARLKDSVAAYPVFEGFAVEVEEGQSQPKDDLFQFNLQIRFSQNEPGFMKKETK